MRYFLGCLLAACTGSDASDTDPIDFDATFSSASQADLQASLLAAIGYVHDEFGVLLYDAYDDASRGSCPVWDGDLETATVTTDGGCDSSTGNSWSGRADVAHMLDEDAFDGGWASGRKNIDITFDALAMNEVRADGWWQREVADGVHTDIYDVEVAGFLSPLGRTSRMTQV